MDWAYLLNSFDGRIGRKPFWIAMAAIFAANLFACLIAGQIGGNRLSAIVDLAFTYPQFAIAVKRCHDRNMPIWVLAAFFGGNAVLDLLIVLDWAVTDEGPTTLWIVVALPCLVVFLALLVELGFRRGTPGPNQYGPDPLAGS